MYVYNWITLLYTWNQHNIVNQLYSNKIKIKKKKKTVTKWVGHGDKEWDQCCEGVRSWDQADTREAAFTVVLPKFP